MSGGSQDFEQLLHRFANTSRWGKDDEAGTLNLMTGAKTLEALEVVRSGRTVSIGHDLRDPIELKNNVDGAQHHMLFTGVTTPSVSDLISVAPHGFTVTHLDAPSHVFGPNGEAYNDRHASELVTRDGLLKGSVQVAAQGIVTRGVFLDVASTRGVPFLEDHEVVNAELLDRAEQLARVSVRPGDAVLVRTGRALRERATSHSVHERAGLDVSGVGWLRDRDVGLFAGDCIEKLPSDDPELPLPLHIIGLAFMGLTLVDWVDMEVLAQVCADEERNAFMFIVAPLRIPGGTGSPVNPLCVF